MSFQKVVVAGGGVLGSQIAYQSAYCGKDVTIWLRSEGSITRTKPKLDQLKKDYEAAIKLMDSDEGKLEANWCRGLAIDESWDCEKALKRSENAYNNIKLELDLAKAVKDADIRIILCSGRCQSPGEILLIFPVNTGHQNRDLFTAHQTTSLILLLFHPRRQAVPDSLFPIRAAPSACCRHS